jgi:hypothetical protein
MCPLCILAAISLGGGTTLAGGLHWVKSKFVKGEALVDGCQSLCLCQAASEDRTIEEKEPEQKSLP